MAPTLGDGDLVLAVRVGRRVIRRGTIVVLSAATAAGGLLIKRVIAVEGEALPHSMTSVPRGTVFIAGDARRGTAGNADSSSYGLIPLARLHGVVVLRIRPRPTLICLHSRTR